jgi:hypothetical protein
MDLNHRVIGHKTELIYIRIYLIKESDLLEARSKALASFCRTIMRLLKIRSNKIVLR